MSQIIGSSAFIVLVTFAPLASAAGPATLDRKEAKAAADYLNRVRQAPAKFSKEVGADLSAVEARDKLEWNDALAKAAEQKALDMANREYFDHVTPEGRGMNIEIHEAGYELPAAWIKDPKQNMFESIAAGPASGSLVVRMLLLDKDLPDVAHRKHLLGMDDFHAGCTDIGVGFARNPQSKYRTYVSILVARRK